MRKPSTSTCIALAVALGPSGAAWAQCEGWATAMTVETRHENCLQPQDALTWTLNIICMDACGQP